MRSRGRLFAALALALLIAPGTWLRSDTRPGNSQLWAVKRLAGPQEAVTPGWQVEGVWQLSGKGMMFGGYSALVALPGARLMAFSDRGARLVLSEPGGAGEPPALAEQLLGPRHPRNLPDIEAATTDPASGTYWIALENGHAIQRFTSAHEVSGVRPLRGRTLGWSANRGAEAMVRLSDGRFLVLPESGREALIFARDPVLGDEPERVKARLPLAGYSVTDVAQLPDGRVLVLLRDLDLALGWPPFAGAIAIAPAPQAGEEKPWEPQLLLDLAEVLPRENYEGIAVRPLAGGRIAVWLISDDNQSLMQRTLLAKLVFDSLKTAE